MRPIDHTMEADMDLSALVAMTRDHLSELLATGASTRDVARMLAELEDEQERRRQFDVRMASRIAGPAETSRSADADFAASASSAGVLSRPWPVNVDERAGVPRTWREPDPAEHARGIAIVYQGINPTWYRSIIERLSPDEKFRMETRYGVFEMSRSEFERWFSNIAKSPSYQRGTDGAPGASRYTTSHVTPTLQRFRVA